MRTWKHICTLAVVGLLSATAVNAQARQNGFSVVLLFGDAQGSGAADSLAPAPGLRKALTDVKDFLPYKNCKVLDTQWLRGGTTRMKGPDDQEYDVDVSGDEIQPNPVHPKAGLLMVLFKLQEVGAAMNASEEYGRSVQVADMEKQLATIQRRLNEGAPGPQVSELMAAKDRLNRQIRLARARKLIDSHFEMAPGETVVVGTSKIGGGDKGLVVPLTAVTTGGK